MTRKGDFVLRQIADEYVLIPYGATAEKMNQVLTLSETAAFIYEQTGDAASAEEIAERRKRIFVRSLPVSMTMVSSLSAMAQTMPTTARKSLRYAGGGSAGARKRSAGNIPKLWYPGACLKNLRKRRGSV